MVRYLVSVITGHSRLTRVQSNKRNARTQRSGGKILTSKDTIGTADSENVGAVSACVLMVNPPPPPEASKDTII